MNKVFLIATAAIMASTGIASAASIDRVQDRQAKRIEHGRQTGKITWTEGLKLRSEQRKISRKEAQFRADGYLSTSERRKLRKMQRKAGKNIRHEKHDSKRRAWWLPRVGF